MPQDYVVEDGTSGSYYKSQVQIADAANSLLSRLMLPVLKLSP